MARRDYGTGSVYQRKDGMWVGTIEAGYTASGGRRRVTVSSKDRRTAVRKLHDKQRQLEIDGPTSTSARVTVKRWAAEWLESRRTVVRPKPWATDASAIGKWVVPTIGHRRLDELTPADIRAVRKAQTDAGLSSSSARRTHTTLTAMLKAAMVEGYAVPPRVLLVKAPGVAANDRDAMPVAEVLLLLQAARELLPHWSRWLAQAYTGARPAEVLGLIDESLDLDRERMLIEWQLQPLPYVDRRRPELGFHQPDGYRTRHLVDAWHLVEVKTKAGFRVVPLIEPVCEVFAEWMTRRPANPWGLVWPTAAGRPANDRHDREEWYGLQDAVGIGHPAGRYYAVQEARHGLATRLLESGADPKVVIELMGHSSILTTRGYQHVDLTQRLAAMEKASADLRLG